MEIHVMVDLADRLYTLLEDKLPNLGRRIERAITKELATEARRESRIAVTVKPSAKDIEPIAPVEPATPETSRPTTEHPETSPERETQAATPKQIAEMVRGVMHVTRQRFEGEDYKGNTNSEAYKKYHRQLTSVFKQIAIALGADLPSLISTTEQLTRFKQECEALIIDEKGDITSPPAPF